MTEEPMYYAYIIYCVNCGEDETVDIPKGKTVKEFLKGYECAYCGCTTMKGLQSDPLNKRIWGLLSG